MILFTLPPFQEEKSHFKELKKGLFSANRFENGELHIDLNTPVKGEECLIYGSITPPDEHLLTLLCLAHTLKKNGAKKCIAAIPYLAYTRQEHFTKGSSQLTDLIAHFLKDSGIDTIFTFDVHSIDAKNLFEVEVVELSSAPLFLKALKKFGYSPDTVVSPDLGGVERATHIAKLLKKPFAFFEKKRDSLGVHHLLCHNEIGKKILIVDDILDTGRTLLSCLKKLKEIGMQDAVIFVTHPLFSTNLYNSFFEYGLEKIFCTDSVPLAQDLSLDTRIEQISLFPYFEEAICKKRSF